MLNRTRITAKLLLLIIALLMLDTPVLVLAEGNHVMNADLAGVSTFYRADGTTSIIDYDGTLRVGLYRQRIVTDFVGSGVIRDTGEAVIITSTADGVFKREGNQLRFRTAGPFTLERDNGNQIVIDVIGAGVILRSGHNIVIDVIGAGIVRGSGEYVRIYTVGTGEMQNSAQ